MMIGVLKETYPGERRVALVPDAIPQIRKAGIDICIEKDAGLEAGFKDSRYEEKGARIIARREEVFKSADILLQVLGGSANPNSSNDIGRFHQGQVLAGFLDPLNDPKTLEQIARLGVTAFALELLPRISRAQGMDALSSMATISGYKAVLLAAESLPKILPMMTTAGGTILPARIFVIGAGVAGLQAIATARRLGGVVSAYDLRPAVKEQVESLGAKFFGLPLEAKGAETAEGYASEMGEEFYKRQRELLALAVAESDIVITTASVPGKRAPVLITADMVGPMSPGSVIIDLAAERGGNCELTRPGETVIFRGVKIFGPIHLASTVPYHASQMYSKNISNFFLHLIKSVGAHRGMLLPLDLKDEIIRDTLVTHDGEVVHPKILELLRDSSKT